MAKNHVKRKVDAHMHRNPEFRELPFKIREAIRVLLGEVDYLGLWPLDIKNLCLWVGAKITLEELQDQKVLTIKVLDGKTIFLPGFVEFTCGDKSGLLNPKNSYHAKVGKDLAALGLPCPRFKEIPIPPPGVGSAPSPGGAVNKNTNTPTHKNQNQTQTKNQTPKGNQGVDHEAEKAKLWAAKAELEEYYRDQFLQRRKTDPFVLPEDDAALERLITLKGMTIPKLKKIINTYVNMEDPWFTKMGWTLQGLEKDLPKVNARSAA